MTNRYVALKREHEKEMNDFPLAFAFSNKQFKEGMEKLGLTEDDTDKVYSIGMGGFMRKRDAEAFSRMLAKHERQMQEAIKNDETGDGFIFEMFDYELGNHEYGYTGDVEPTLDALGLTEKEVIADNRLVHGLDKARKLY